VYEFWADANAKANIMTKKLTLFRLIEKKVKFFIVDFLEKLELE